MIPVLAGLVIREEEALAAKPEESAPSLQRHKGMLMGPLAALGDSFFWSAFKPLMLLLGVAWSVIVEPPLGKAVGGLVIWGGYNFVRFWIMWKGLAAGYERGLSAVGLWQDLPIRAAQCQTVSVVVAAGLAALLYPWASVSVGGHEVAPGFLALAAMAIFVLGLRVRISSTALLYLAVAACVVLGYVVPLPRVLHVEVPW